MLEYSFINIYTILGLHDCNMHIANKFLSFLKVRVVRLNIVFCTLYALSSNGINDFMNCSIHCCVVTSVLS